MSADNITVASKAESTRTWELPIGVWDQHRDLFEVLNELPGGGQAKIVRVTYLEDGKVYILKIYKHRATGTLESNFLAAVKGHPNLVYQERFLDNFPESGFCSLLLRRCDEGNLLECLHRHLNAKIALSEMFIWKVFAHLADALARLHWGVGTDNFDENEPYTNPNRIVHRDIKPENIFLLWDSDTANGNTDPFPSLQLGDFGLSRSLPNGKATLQGWRGGTPSWQPPEQITKPFISGPAQDIWSIGAIIHGLALGGAPIDSTQGDPEMLKKDACLYDQTCPRKVQNISKRPGRRQDQWKEYTSCTQRWGGRYSRRLNFYMAQCLTTDPELRPTAWTLSRTMGEEFRVVAAEVGNDPDKFETRMRKWNPPCESRRERLRKMLEQIGKRVGHMWNPNVDTL
jgi:serine/threonine protein kinase